MSKLFKIVTHPDVPVSNSYFVELSILSASRQSSLGEDIKNLLKTLNL